MTPPPPRLLVADDDVDVREVLCEVLAGEGYEPVGAGSAQAALDALDRQIFRGVLTDAFAVDGRERLELVSAIVEKARPTPVGLLSGWPVSERELAQKGLRFAMMKPFDMSALLLEIARMLGEPLDPDRSEAAGIARRYFEALEAKDWDALLSICAEDVRFTGPQGSRFSATIEGHAALRRHSEETFAVFSDARFRELTFYATPGGVAARYLGTWTTGGAPMQQAGVLLLHLENGRIRRIGVEMNQALLERLAPR